MQEEYLATYSKKVELALGRCKKLEEVEEIEDAVQKTSQLNRRKKADRELTVQLLKLCNDKSQELITNGATPF